MRISLAGASGLLLDVAGDGFSEPLQERIWAAADRLAGCAQVEQVVPGVNNLLVTFDVLAVEPAAMEALLAEVWRSAEPGGAMPSREIVIPVAYGGAFGADLAAIAAEAGLSEAAVIAAHQAAQYRVAAIGSMPGFAYLTGLDPRLALPRRDSPRLNVPRGAVMIGGGQAGILPCTAPSGWHVLGHTETVLFDPDRAAPCLFRLGDRVRFRSVACQDLA